MQTARHTVVFADDHEVVREALRHYMTRHSSFDVVACVSDAQAAVNACARLEPDLLILDIEMPGRDALSALADVRAASPRTRSVILSAFSRPALVQRALAAGASGYLLKFDSPDQIFRSLEQVARGGQAFSEGVSPRTSPVGPPNQGTSPISHLSQREHEVLRYIGRGLTNDAMAEAMCVSKRTVERHISRLMDAVGIRGRAGLMRLAFEQGLVD